MLFASSSSIISADRLSERVEVVGLLAALAIGGDSLDEVPVVSGMSAFMAGACTDAGIDALFMTGSGSDSISIDAQCEGKVSSGEWVH